MSDRRLRRALFCSVAAATVFAAHGAAFAQSTDNDASQAERQENQPAPLPGENEVEQVVVTGSRISQAAANSPQPVQIVTSEAIELQGVTQTEDLLDRLPALLGSESSAQAEDAASGGGFASTLNLRNLGTARTLVLVDGRRHVAGVPGSAAVDISTIPSGLIERVEVLTGGASAVYGSDAVTGVVNFILKRDFEGTEINFQAGISEELDAEEIFASVLHGRNFGGGRGNVTVGFQATSRQAAFYGDRDFSRDNRVANDYSNPALFFQATDPIPTGRTLTNTRGRTILLANGSPRFPNTDPALVARATAAPPRAFINDPRFSISSTSGLIGIDLDGDGFAEPAGFFASAAVNAACNESRAGQRGFGCYTIDKNNQVVRPFRDGIYAGANNQSGGDGAAETFNENSLRPEAQQYAANLLLTYEVTPALRPFFEFKAVRNLNSSFGPYGFFDDSIPIKMDNPFIPQALRDIIAAERAAGNATADAQITLSRDFVDLIGYETRQVRDTYRLVTGFNGDLAEGWNYEVSMNYGRTRQVTQSTDRLEDRFFSAVDAVLNPATGQPVCRSTLNPTAVPPISFLYDQFPGPIPNFGATFTPGANSPCRPANLFGETTISPEARAFIAPQVEDTSVIQQFVLSGVLVGDTNRFFRLPGGPIGFAVGGEYREEKSRFDPNPFDEAGQGFQYLATAGVSGKFDVREWFAEISIPLFSGQPFAETLSLSAAVRGGNYSTIGDTKSYKVDAIYAPIRDIRFRGGYATTVRAPNIAELFTPLTSAVFRPIDPCDVSELKNGSPNREANCRQDLGIAPGAPYTFVDPLTARFTGQTGGNPNLQEETSDSYTYGVVLRPRFLSGLSATVDYWNIRIENAIATVSDQDIVNACYDAPSLNNQYCVLFTRNRTPGSPTFLGFNYLRTTLLNFSALDASGVDFAANYRVDLGDFGQPTWGVVTLGLAGTWMEERNDYPFVQEPDRPNPELGELTVPEWAINTNIRWQINNFTVSLFSSYLSRQALAGVEIENAKNFAPAFTEDNVWTHDASVRWAIRPNLDVTVGVNNLTNMEPFVGSVTNPISPIGRSYFFRLGAKL